MQVDRQVTARGEGTQVAQQGPVVGGGDRVPVRRHVQAADVAEDVRPRDLRVDPPGQLRRADRPRPAAGAPQVARGVVRELQLPHAAEVGGRPQPHTPHHRTPRIRQVGASGPAEPETLVQHRDPEPGSLPPPPDLHEGSPQDVAQGDRQPVGAARVRVPRSTHGQPVERVDAEQAVRVVHLL